MLQRVHSSHVGADACIRKAKDTLFWPRMAHEIRDFVEKCGICNQFQKAQPKQTMISYEFPSLPWDYVSLDLFVESDKNYLIIVDHYSDYWELCKLTKNTSSTAVISACKEQFARHGIPRTVITDNGPQFTGWDFKQFAQQWSLSI